MTSAPVGLLRAIWRYRWVVAGTTIIAALVGFFGATLLPTRYEATSSMHLADPDQGGVFGEMREGVEGDPYLLNEAQGLTSTPVLERAAQMISPSPTIGELRDVVQGRATLELNSIKVTAQAPTGRRAAEIADAVAAAYQDVSSEQRRERALVATDELKGYIDVLNQELQAADAELEDRRDEALREAEATISTLPDVNSRAAAASQVLDADLEYQNLLLERQAILTQLRAAQDKAKRIQVDAKVVGSGVLRFDRAEVPNEPLRPQRLFAVLAAFVGFLGASGLAWRLAEERAEAERGEDVASSVGVPLLGEVPPFRSPSNVPGVSARGGVTRARIMAVPYSAAGESFQYALSSLLATLGGEDRTPVVVVAGTQRGDGGTSTALNLGFAASQRHMRVAIFDADFRQRGLTKLCGLSAEPGASESDGNPPRAYDVAHDGRLKVVPTGNSFGDAIGYLNSASFTRAVNSSRALNDLILLDVPPVLTAADALSVAAAADGLVLVVGLGRSHDDLEEAARILVRAPAPLVGYVFNQPHRWWFSRLWRTR